MWLYRKAKNNKASDGKESIADKAATRIASVGIRLQKIFAEKMSRLFMKTDFKRLKFILIFFCITAGGYSLYLVANSIIGPAKNQKHFEVQQMDVPKHFNNTGDDIIPDAFVDEETWFQIKTFRMYIDSLKQYSPAEYDSVLQARPGLMDSVQLLEQIYLSQKQK